MSKKITICYLYDISIININTLNKTINVFFFFLYIFESMKYKCKM